MTFDEVKRALADRAEEVCKYLLPRGGRKGNHWRIGSIGGEEGGSLAVCLGGPTAGSFFDHAADVHGDNLLELWRLVRGVEFAEALRQAQAWLGVAGAPRGNASQAPASALAKLVSWEKDTRPFTDEQVRFLCQRRGYAEAMVCRLGEAGLIAYHPSSRSIAFPVHEGGKVTRIHLFDPERKRRPFYLGSGNIQPLVIGNPDQAATMFCLESQWDMISVAEAHGWHWDGAPGHAFLATRGKSNGGRIGQVVQRGQTVVFVMQNDAPDSHGDIAAEQWLASALASLPEGVKAYRLDPPGLYDDAQAWHLAVGGDVFKTEFEQVPRNPIIPNNRTSSESFADLSGFPDGVDSCSGPQEKAENSSAPFPLAALPTVPYELAARLRDFGDFPEALLGCCALGFLSAAIGPGLVVRSLANGDTCGANVYVAGAGGSSSGKTLPYKYFGKPLFEFDRQQQEIYRTTQIPRIGRESKILRAEQKGLLQKIERDDPPSEHEARLEEIEKRLGELDRQHPPRLFTEDATPPALVRLMGTQIGEAISSISDDGRKVIDLLCGRHNNGQADDDFYVKAWSRTMYAFDRSTDRTNLVLHSPWLSGFWLVQPEKLRSLTDRPEFFDSGFIQRLLICDTGARARKLSRNAEVVPEILAQEWRKLVHALLETYRCDDRHPPRTVEPDRAAAELLWDYADSVVDRQNGELSDMPTLAGKWGENAWRIAVILHAGEFGARAHLHTLSLETAANAIRLMQWFSAEAIRILAPGRERSRDTRLQQLVQVLRSGRYPLEEGASQGQLKDRHGFEREELAHLCATYPAVLKMVPKPATEGKGGRPTFYVLLAK